MFLLFSVRKVPFGLLGCALAFWAEIKRGKCIHAGIFLHDYVHLRLLNNIPVLDASRMGVDICEVCTIWDTLPHPWTDLNDNDLRRNSRSAGQRTSRTAKQRCSQILFVCHQSSSVMLCFVCSKLMWYQTMGVPRDHKTIRNCWPYGTSSPYLTNYLVYNYNTYILVPG